MTSSLQIQIFRSNTQGRRHTNTTKKTGIAYANSRLACECMNFTRGTSNLRENNEGNGKPSAIEVKAEARTHAHTSQASTRDNANITDRFRVAVLTTALYRAGAPKTADQTGSSGRCRVPLLKVEGRDSWLCAARDRNQPI